jgi:hypothetical protein
MSYTINRYNGTQVGVVADGTIDSTLSLKLIGKNYAGYGEVQNENLVHLLENFSGSTSPNNPISGQVWFDSANSKIKFYDGSKFRVASGAEASATAPVGLTPGDFWYDTSNKQIYVWNGTTFTLVGPQSVAGAGTTQMQSISVIDDVGANHSVIQAVTNGQVMYIISADQFTLNSGLNPITGFTKIGKGITLVNSTTGSVLGITSTGDQKYWGTASNADYLGGYAASEYLRASTTSFADPIHFSNQGYTVGSNRDLVVNITGSTPVIANVLSNTITFQTTVSGTTKTPMSLVGTDIIPGDTNISSIGSPTKIYNTIYAGSFSGIASQSNQVLETVSGLYRSGNTGAAASTVAVRDASADLYANVFQGIASSADYADLAEKYLADLEYLVGTVVAIGGEKEVTACTVGDRAIGIVSANPAYMMNSGLEGGTYIALKGRVPCKVIGQVKKGQRLVAGLNGAAQAAYGANSDVFAIALETSDDAGEKTIEVLVL